MAKNGHFLTLKNGPQIQNRPKNGPKNEPKNDHFSVKKRMVGLTSILGSFLGQKVLVAGTFLYPKNPKKRVSDMPATKTF